MPARAQRHGQELQYSKLHYENHYIYKNYNIKKYLKWTNELQSDDGHMLLTLTYIQSHSSHIDILKDNSTYHYSNTYNILSQLSISEV